MEKVDNVHTRVSHPRESKSIVREASPCTAVQQEGDHLEKQTRVEESVCDMQEVLLG